MKKDWKYYLNHFESYIGAGLFIFICILMLVQVISRYVFGRAITWAEEAATIAFVPMVYCGYAAAVTDRKHVSVEAIQFFMPFKVRKVMKIVSQIIFLFFCIYMQGPLYNVINNLGDSVTDLMRIPKRNIYLTIPILLILVALRIVQDIIRLFKEDESSFGKSKPALDLESLEQEYLRKRQADEARNSQPESVNADAKKEGGNA